MWWNTICCMFVVWRDRTTFTDYATARQVAKECSGVVVNTTTGAVRVCEYSDCEGRRSIVDIIESAPTNSGKVPPTIVDAIERALVRGNVVEVSWEEYKEGESA